MSKWEVEICMFWGVVFNRPQDVFKYLISLNESVFNMVEKIRENIVFSFLHYAMSESNSF